MKTHRWAAALCALLSLICANAIHAALPGDDGKVYPGTTKRFHPGHYMLIFDEPDPVRKLAQMTRYAAEVGSNPNLQGIAVRYRWTILESSKDVYDFSQIRTDINLLKAQNKRLIVQIRASSFPVDPFITVPAYMRTPEYEGGQANKIISPVNPTGEGYTAKHWLPVVGERYRALIRAIAREFKDEPYLEAFRSEETALGVDTSRSNTIGYTYQAYVAQLKLNIDTLAESFPNTVTVQEVNYLSGSPNLLATLTDLTAYARDKQVGIGGPDIAPRQPGLLNGAYRLYPLHDGFAPLMTDVQSAAYETRNGGPYTPDELLAFSISDLKLNYICWIRNTHWPRVLTTIAKPIYAGRFPVVPATPSVQFNAGTYSVNEGGNASIAVTRSGNRLGPLSVDYMTSNGTAVVGTDYTPASGTLNFADGDIASKSFPVVTTPDTAVELDETVTLNLSNPSRGAILGTRNTVVLNVINDDADALSPVTPLPIFTPPAARTPSAAPTPPPASAPSLLNPTPTQTSETGGGGGGGGCSLNTRAAFDPALPALLIAAAFYLFRRRRIA